MGGNSMAELSRYHIVSCGDEFAVLFFKELFENIDAETETGVTANSEPKTEAQTEPSRKRSSIVILDGEEIEEF